MSEISRWINTFVLNAVWQITAISMLAFLCARLLRRLPARYAHRAWVLALLLSFVTPLATVVIQESAGPGVRRVARTEVVANEPLTRASGRLSMPLHSLSHSIYIPPILSRTLPWFFALLVLYRAMRLGWSMHRTERIRRCAQERPVPASVLKLAERCLRAFSLPAIPLLCSDDVPSPATVGFRRAVLLLPENFFSTDLGEDVLLSALSHECAHIQRGDFALNLLYEILYLTVCFHPCTAFMRSRIAHTRELACDEMAVGMLPCQARYATSLLDLAQSMFWGNRPPATYALGLFDTNALEERIMNILKSTKASSKWARVLRLTAVSLVGAVALAISAFSLTVAVENATSLGQFTGTWQCKYRGQPFFTLNMAVAGGVLGGTAVHPTRVAWVDGELLPGSAVNPSEADEMVQGEIFDAHLSDQQLFIKIADGPDKSDVLQLSFKLVGKDEAEAMAVIEKTSEGPPPQKKPWHFQRVSQ